MEINKQTIGIAAGVLGSLFVGYCIYFDHKRRADPEYKKKVRERRRKAKNKGSGRSEMPNMIDRNAVQNFFLQEVQMGEAYIARGELEKGVEHFANAVIVCGQPTQLLQVLQQTLPAQVFAMLIMKVQEYHNKESGNMHSSGEARIVDADELE